MAIRRLVIFLCVLVSSLTVALSAQKPAAKAQKGAEARRAADAAKADEKWVQDTLKKMTLDEKVGQLIATSIDRPGIIHQICKALHGRGINIDDISTNVDNNPVSGANVFQMVCFFSLPPAVKILDLKNDLNRIGDESNIDIRFDAVICK